MGEGRFLKGKGHMNKGLKAVERRGDVASWGGGCKEKIKLGRGVTDYSE